MPVDKFREKMVLLLTIRVLSIYFEDKIYHIFYILADRIQLNDPVS